MANGRNNGHFGPDQSVSRKFKSCNSRPKPAPPFGEPGDTRFQKRDSSWSLSPRIFLAFTFISLISPFYYACPLSTATLNMAGEEDLWEEDDPALAEAIEASIRDFKPNSGNKNKNNCAEMDQDAQLTRAIAESLNPNQSTFEVPKNEDACDDIVWDYSAEIYEAINESTSSNTRNSSSNDEEAFLDDDSEFEQALLLSLAEMDNFELDQRAAKGASFDSNSLEEKADWISRTGCVVDPELETIDPNPNIWKLFSIFDDRFFNGRLAANGVEVDWSPHMTTCAGLCRWSPRNRHCQVRLSQPLLSLRPRKDFVETLIHEMIHAILFITNEDDNHESHGTIFHQHMHRINKQAGCHITVYHSFHDEVRYYKRHVWRCNGRCRYLAPFYGLVRRARNRAPGPSDFWHANHLKSCGGTFIKISDKGNTHGDPDFDSKSANDARGKKKKETKSKVQQPDIRNFFTPSPKKDQSLSQASTSSHPSDSTATGLVIPPGFVPFSGTGHVLGSRDAKQPQTKPKSSSQRQKGATKQKPEPTQTSSTVTAGAGTDSKRPKILPATCPAKSSTATQSQLVITLD